MPYNTQGRSHPRNSPPAPPPPRSGGVDPWGDNWTAPVGYTGYGGDPSYGSDATQPKATDTPQWDPNPGAPQGPGSAQPSPWAWTTDYDTGVFNHPGYDEQWWQGHADQYDQPSASEQYWNANSGRFAAGPERSVGAQQGYDAWFQPLSSPGFSEVGAAAGARGTDYAGGAYANRTLGGSRSGAFVDAGGPQFKNFGGDAYANNADNTTFNAGAAFDRYFEPLSQNSFSEDLYSQDPGLGAYYDRAYSVGSEKLANAMAAKGLFQSGTAADEERSLIADLGADRAKNEASYRLSAAGQADTERRGRMGLAGQLGAASDASSLGRSTNARNWAGMLDDTELAQASERRAGREFADSQDLARDRANLDWTGLLDDMSLRRSADSREWAKAGDQSRLSRSGEARNWTELLGNETERNNRDTLDFLREGGVLAGDADRAKLDRMGEGREGAESAQHSIVQRYQDQFNNLLDVAKAKAGQVTNATDAANKEKLDLIMEQLKAELAAATNDANLSNASRDRIEKLFSDAVKLSS